jgi:hypothetical protein
MESCEVCGRQIGKLETPHLYKDRVVCRECHGGLSQSPNVPHAGVQRKSAQLPKPVAILCVLLFGAMMGVVIGLSRRTARLELELSDLRNSVNHNAGFDSLTDAVSRNTKVANASTASLARELDALTDTVNHNARVADESTASLARGLDSLTDTVNHNAEVANLNNR